jgi:hypothetical protein
VSDLCDFSKSYPNKRFLLLWIGDAPRDNYVLKKVEKLLQSFNNVFFIKTGYVLPVPTRLLEMCDVLISSSGSSWPCLRSGVPTITYDANDCKPIGVLGKTTNNSLFRSEDETPIDLSDFLEKILIKRIIRKVSSNYNTAIPNFSDHLEFLSNMEKEQMYYDVDSVRIESFLEKKISLVLTVFGAKGYIHLHKIKNRIFK